MIGMTHLDNYKITSNFILATSNILESHIYNASNTLESHIYNTSNILESHISNASNLLETHSSNYTNAKSNLIMEYFKPLVDKETDVEGKTHTYINNCNILGEIRFTTLNCTEYAYNNNAKYLARIREDGQLQLYYNYTLQFPTVLGGWYGVMESIRDAYAYQATNGGVIAEVQAAINLLTNKLEALEQGVGAIAVNVQMLNGWNADQVQDLITDIGSHGYFDIFSTASIMGISAVGIIGIVSSWSAGVLYNDYLRAQYEQLQEMNNPNVSSAQKETHLTTIRELATSNLSNINSNLSNLIILDGFINSNITTAQTIPNIKTSNITINNTGSATYSLINFSNATNNSAGYVGLGGIVSGYHNNNMIYKTPGAHVFNVPGQDSLSVPAFAINSFGNVGIGINPSAYSLYRFSVSGDIYIHTGGALRTNSIIYNSQELSTTLNNYLLKSGGTMTGALTTNSIIYNAQELSTTLNNYLLKSGGTMTDTLLFNTGLFANPGPYPNGFDGDRIILQTGIGTNGYPYSVGINTDVFWNCAPASASYKWYSGATNTATLDNTGLLTLPSITTTADLAVNGKTQLLGYTVVGYPYFDFESYASASIFADTKSINLILQSQNASQGAGIITVNNSGATAAVSIGGTSATPTILRNNLYLLSQNALLFNTSNNATETPNMIILANGNIGIGISNPSSKLYVNGTTTMTAQLSITANSASSLISLTNTHSIGQGILQTNNLGGYARLTYYNSGAGGYYTCNYVLEASSNNAAIVMNTGGNTSNSIPRFILNSSGNIGIGISNPSNKLEVSGNISQTGNTFTIGNSTGGVTLNLTDIVNAAWQIKTGGYNLSFFNNDGGTFSNRVVFMRNGNVGIGTDTAASLLHIKGTNPAITVMAQGASGASSTLNLTTYNNTTNAPNCSLSATDTGDYGATFQIKQKLAGADTNGQFTSFIMDKDGNAAFGNTTYASTKLYVNGKARFEDVVTFTTGNWNMSRDGVYRTYYGNNSTSYYSCGNDANTYAHYFMKSASQSYGAICIMKNNGNIDTYGDIDCGGCIAISGSTTTYNPSSIAENASLTNTYIAFKGSTVGAGNDWAYLRQIGGNESIKLSLDFHDDANDARFCIRSIASAGNNPDVNYEVFTVDNGNVSCTGSLNVGALTRSRNYHNYGTTLNYRTSFDGTNGPGWYMVTNAWWQDINTVSYVNVAITCLGQNAVWFGRIFIGQNGGFYQTICDMRNPTNGNTNQIDVSDVWNSGGVNALKIVINNATYGGQFNVKFSG